MISIPGCTISGKLHDTHRTIVFRGVRTSDSRPVIIKCINPLNHTSTALARLEREYEILLRLEDKRIPGVIAFDRPGNNPVLILEDSGGSALDKIPGFEKQPVADILRVAAAIAATLGTIHSAGIIHNDINPANIVLNPRSRDIQIIDFNRSEVFTGKGFPVNDPEMPEGALPYISPEQTRRVNRLIDYRTDMYSFGVTLYRMLTGKLPFTGGDSIEIVHAHIAGSPVPLHEIRPELPGAVSRIVEKLLSKNPADRYQNANGLVSDLHFCIDRISEKENLDTFAPGLLDFPETMSIPDKLYERDEEIGKLLRSCERVAGGGTEMLLVSGPSGIGKTCLVHHFRKMIHRESACFVSGKFDQYRLNRSYESIFEAFSGLIEKILGENRQSINRWKNRILKAVGANGQLMIECVPDLEIIIGKQPSVEKLPPVEARNRFQSVFLNFIRAFADREHPLIIFLDDLQWADRATLELLRVAIEDMKSPFTMVIGAFRDNSIEDLKHLTAALEKIEQTRTHIIRIPLEPLSPPAVNRMIAETLEADSNEVIVLSEKIRAKTGGNPYFTKEFLKSFHREGAIYHDRSNGRWQWNIRAIRKTSVTDNVVDLMIRKIYILPPDVARLLMLAACIGSRFDLKTLCLISHENFNNTLAFLWQALREELIGSARENEVQLIQALAGKNRPEKHANGQSAARIPPIRFSFVHDRVQEAAYGMFSAREKMRIHLRIGLLMLARTPREQLDEYLFDIVGHFNLAESMIHDPDEKLMLARLNARAGAKAMRQAAHDTALKCFSGAIGLLPDDSWETHYDLSLSIYIGCAQAEFLNRRISLSESRYRFLLEKVKTEKEKIDIHHALVRVLSNQEKYKEAVEAGITALRLLGFRIPASPGRKTIRFKSGKLRRKLRTMRMEDLFSLGDIDDDRTETMMDILSEITAAAMTHNNFLAVYTGLTMMELTLENGNCRHSPFAYCVFGAILAGTRGEVVPGNHFGRLALSMTEHSENRGIACITRLTYAICINHRVRHASTGIGMYRNAYEEGIESGNTIFAARAAMYLLINHMVTGSGVSRIREELERYGGFIRNVRYREMQSVWRLMERYIQVLEGDTGAQATLSADGPGDAELRPETKETGQTPAVSILNCLMETQLFFLAGNYEKALERSGRIEALASETPGQIFLPEHYFYKALLLARTCTGASRLEKRRILREIEEVGRRMGEWADQCRENYGHKHLLIRAETARIKNKTEAAPALYNRAIQHAINAGYIQDEAIANECAARFCMDTGSMELANAYLANAHFAYLKWGAAGKAAQMEKDFPSLSLFAASEGRTGLIEPTAASAPAPVPASASPGRQFSELLDWRSMLKTFQAISRDIDLPALIQTMMDRIVENAGAQRGVLILEREEKLYIEAENRFEWGQTLLTHSIPLADYQAIPASMIHYTAHKRIPFILADAAVGHMFAEDPYFARRSKQSVLASPIVHQRKLKGIIYLENDSAPSVFTKDRAQAIDMLSAQAAVSLENAMLYEQLKASESKYRSMFENAIEGIFQITRQGTFISANQSLAAILGCDTPGELIDSETNVADLFFFESDRKKHFLRELKETGRIRNFEGSGRRRDGNPFWVSVSVRTVFDAMGNVSYYEGSVVDMSERKQKEEALRQRKAAEAAARAKSIFLANMSHEIRTPLNAIIGLSELSAAGSLDGKQREFNRKINDCASSLLTTIDDILQFSKLEAGRVEPEKIDFSISGIVEKLETLFAHRVSEKNIRLDFLIANNIPQAMIGDPLRIGQVLTNLVGNAFKFTQSGRITIGAKCIHRESPVAALRFYVSDTGTGINEAQITRLFDAFTQADNSVSRLYGGTGLGLAICKGIVEIMNGRIWAKNNPDRGASFFFEVEVRYREDNTAPKQRKTGKIRPMPQYGPVESKAGTPGLRLLFVDDNAINREVTPGILEKSGYLVDTAPDGRKAVEMARRIRYDAVLMDVQMPGMDGFETARAMRRDPGNRDLVIVAMTAYAMKGYRKQCRDAGMTDYIPKPVEMNRLHQILQRHRNPADDALRIVR